MKPYELVGSLESPLKVKFSHSAIYDVFECPQCFALVMRDNIGKHDSWHTEMRGLLQ